MPHISRKWIKRASIAGVGALATLAIVGAAGFFTSGVSVASDSSAQPKLEEDLWQPLTDVRPGDPLTDVQPGVEIPLTSDITLAIPVISDKYEYKNLGTDRCLTFDPDDGYTAVTAPCDGTPSQMWTAGFNLDNAPFPIVNLGTELCLEGDGPTLTVYITDCTFSMRQLWQWTGTGFRNWENKLVLVHGRDKWPYLAAADDAKGNYGQHAWWQVNAR